jgi:hypothetical protein
MSPEINRISNQPIAASTKWLSGPFVTTHELLVVSEAILDDRYGLINHTQTLPRDVQQRNAFGVKRSTRVRNLGVERKEVFRQHQRIALEQTPPPLCGVVALDARGSPRHLIGPPASRAGWSEVSLSCWRAF